MDAFPYYSHLIFKVDKDSTRVTKMFCPLQSFSCIYTLNEICLNQNKIVYLNLSMLQKNLQDDKAQQHGQQQQELKKEDALSYVAQVKRQCVNEPHVYREFLKIMKGYMSQV